MLHLNKQGIEKIIVLYQHNIVQLINLLLINKFIYFNLTTEFICYYNISDDERRLQQVEGDSWTSW